MSDLSTQRRYFAEELEAICDLRTPLLVDAFARVPREDYLTPGPWLVRSESDYFFSTVMLFRRTGSVP